MTATTGQADHIRVTRGGEPVVFLHGIGAGAEMFAPQLEGLGAGVDAIGWNLPGYGGTGLIDPMTFEGLSEALAALLDRLGIARATLVGHSIGGMVAQDFIARHPERVKALVLSATVASFGSRDGSFQKAFLEARLAPLDAGQTMPQLAEEFVPQLLGDDPNPEAGPRARTGLSGLPQATYRTALKCLVTFNRREELAAFSAPTLLIAGEKDTNAPLKTMRKMAEVIPGAQLVELAGVGHLAPLERPEAVADAVAGFLNTLAGEG